MVKKVMDGSDPMHARSMCPVFAQVRWYDAIKRWPSTALGIEDMVPEAAGSRPSCKATLITKENAKDFYFPDSPF